ncbi:MAG: FIST signal transduction protein [Acidimicrobiia bacterium]
MSEHPLATHAAGEVVGSVLEQVGEAPELAVLFVTADHMGALDDIAAVVRRALRPGCMIGSTAVSVLAARREVESRPAVSLWAGRFGAPVTPVRLDLQHAVTSTPMFGLVRPSLVALGDPVAGMLDDHEDRVLVVVADPFSVPLDRFLATMQSAHAGLRVCGGIASAGRGPRHNRLLCDETIYRDGAVGALLPPGASCETVVSQGCRPIGEPMVVTRADGLVLHELAGQPALDRLMEVLDTLDPEIRELADTGLQLGHVIDERKLDFRRGDFVIRSVMAGDRRMRALAIGGPLEVGMLVQFQVRDATSADEDLRLMLAGTHAGGALVFTDTGRGEKLFGSPDHDAEVVDAHADNGATAGMFCAGEVGPVGGQSLVHRLSVSVALFNDQ